MKWLQIAINYIWWLWNLPKTYDKERRSSKKYKAKKKIVRDMWIPTAIGCFILLHMPALSWLAFVVVILVSLLSFVVLDETD